MKDFITDNNPRPLYAADESRPLPSYASGVDMSGGDLEKIASAAFGDPARRLFPCHTPGACLLSNIYWHGTGGSDPATSARLSKAASFHGIAEDVEVYAGYFSARRETEKQASATPEPRFALKVDDGSGIQGYYPADTTDDVVKSARDLLSDFDRGKLPVPFYRHAAGILVKLARSMGIKDLLHERLHHAGEERLFSKASALRALSCRRAFGLDKEAMDLYQGIVDTAASAGEDEDLEKLAGAMHDLDRTFSVSYGMRMPDPFTAFYGAGEITEEEELRTKAASNVFLSGVMVPLDVFEAHGVPLLSRYKSFSKRAGEDKAPDPTPSSESELDRDINRADKVQELIDTLSADEQKEMLARLLKTYRKMEPVLSTPLPPVV